MKQNKDIEVNFEECDTCRAKAGSPYMCTGCYKNRQMIGTLKEFLNDLLKSTESK